MSRLFRKILFCLPVLLGLVSLGSPSYAQSGSTAAQVVNGFLLAQGSSYGGYTCPSTAITPCFVQYGSSIPVTGTITANLAGFTPTAAATATLAASGTSADVALPAGTDIELANPSSTVTAFYRIQVGAGTAVTTDTPIFPNQLIGIHVGTATHLSAITGGSAVTLQITGGSGLFTGAGGGGGSGGGSTNATIVAPLGTQTLAASVAMTIGDGNDVTLGAKADSVCGTATGSCSLEALIKYFNQSITADPCGGAKSFAPFSLTASGQIITGTASKKTYVCSIDLVTATAQNIALVEGTGTTCATNIFGLAGGTTAATGWNFAANGGLIPGSGIGTVAFGSGDANATAANVCLLLSSTGQTSGTFGYVQQ